jgi:uncharacterized protein
MMAFLGWVVRALFVLMLVRLVLRGLFGSGAPRPPKRRPTPPPGERSGGTLVRDPHCGTFLPVNRAIRVGAGTDARYFCSDACRDAYTAAHRSFA